MGVPLALATATSVSLSVRPSVCPYQVTWRWTGLQLAALQWRYNGGLHWWHLNREFSFARQVALWSTTLSASLKTVRSSLVHWPSWSSLPLLQYNYWRMQGRERHSDLDLWPFVLEMGSRATEKPHEILTITLYLCWNVANTTRPSVGLLQRATEWKNVPHEKLQNVLACTELYRDWTK